MNSEEQDVFIENLSSKFENEEFGFLYICDSKIFSQIYSLIKGIGSSQRKYFYTAINFLSKALLSLGKSINENMNSNTQYTVFSLIPIFKIFSALHSWMYFSFMLLSNWIKGQEENNEKSRRKKDLNNFTDNDEEYYKEQEICKLLKNLWELIPKVINQSTPEQIFKEFSEVFLLIINLIFLHKNLICDTLIIDELKQIIEFLLSSSSTKVNELSFKICRYIFQSINKIEDSDKHILKIFNNLTKYEIKNMLIRGIISELPTYTSKIKHQEESKQIKRLSNFIGSLSEKEPRTFLLFLNNILQLLVNDDLQIKKAGFTVLTNIIFKIFSNYGDVENNMKDIMEKNKNILMEYYFIRLNDKLGKIRAYIYKMLTFLIHNDCVDNEHLFKVLERAEQSLKDSNSDVRRKAMLAIQYCIIDFSNKFKTDRFFYLFEIDKRIEICKKKLSDLEEEINNEDTELKKINLQELNEEKQKQKEELIHYELYHKVIALINKSLEKAITLLNSDKIWDLIGSMKLIYLFHKFRIEQANQGIRRMLYLVTCKDKSVKENVIELFMGIFFDKKSIREELIVPQIIDFMKDVEDSELYCLEIILQEALSKNKDYIDAQFLSETILVYVKPQNFTLQDNTCELKSEDINIRKAMISESKAALKLLNLIVGSLDLTDYSMLIKIIQDGIKNSLQSTNPDYNLLEYEFKILKKIIKNSNIDYEFFNTMIVKFILIETSDTCWFVAFNSLVDCLFSIYHLKEKLCNFLIYLLIMKLKRKQIPQDVNSKTFLNYNFAHFLEGSCYILFKYYIHIEEYETQVKASLREETNKNANQNEEKEKEISVELNEAREDRIDTLLSEINFKIKGLFGKDSFFSILSSILKEILTKIIAKYSLQREPMAINLAQEDELIERISIYSYNLLLCISEELCLHSVEDIFKLMTLNLSPYLRASISYSLGDFFIKYPNLVEKYRDKLFELLNCNDIIIKKSVLIVLSGLTLSDSVKVKGDICDICLLNRSDDDEIQQILKMFLFELNQKENNDLCNMLPQALSKMRTVYGNIPYEEFKKFADCFMEFVEKERHSDMIVEKLCLKIQQTQDEIECRNIVYCLKLIKYNDRILRKFLDYYDSWKDKLSIQSVYKEIKELLEKLKKFSKVDKNLIEELNAKLNESNSEAAQALKKYRGTTKKKDFRNKKKMKTREENKLEISKRNELNQNDNEEAKKNEEEEERQARLLIKEYEKEMEDESDDEDFEEDFSDDSD